MHGKKILYRAGMIPYVIEDGEVKMMFMKPSDTMYGGDQFQMCKGVVEEGEDNRTASLREAAEELGLRYDNILSIIELGNFLGRTAVYVSKVRDCVSFDEPHYETSATAWLTCDEFLKVGRDLHKDIVQLVDQVIRKDEDLD
jgi:predicted NUDIX family NTP pyrophosphohydrolase